VSKTIAWAEGTFVNVTEPFTVMLTNEAQQFATDSNRKVTSAQSYHTDIIVIRGSQERTDYTIGNITSGSGITVSKDSKRVTFSVSADTTIGADTGVIEIPITLDGQTVKKQFSWSCGKQGPQGVKGEDGSNFAWNLLKGTGTAKEFTPKGNLTNQTTLFNKLDLSGQTLKEGDKFVISCDLEWTQFTQGTSGTFDYWFQGSVDYSWSYDNIFTQGLQKVQPTKAEILASDGKKHLSAVCTMKQSLLDKKIFEIGIRFDNTDGTGKIKISNLKIAKEDKESPWCLHPDELKGATGDKGKSVQSVIEYYLATSASTGVTTSTSGWSTDPTTQKLTAEKKYLWNCKQTVYDDGTRGSITSPVICGTYGDKGDTGQKGQDGTSIKITSKSVTYQTSTSGTTAPTGTWSTTVPTVNNGQYLWTKTTVQYSDGNKTEAYSVSYKGTNGTNGTSVTVSKTEVTYQVSTSGTTAPTGTWSTTMPSCDQGQYLWTKTYVKYSDGKDTTSYSVSYKGVDGEKFSWNALIGSSFLYNSLPNNVNFSMVTVNNVSATAFTTNGLHYKATASNGAPNSSRGVKINSSVLDLKVGDTVTFSCDVKGTFGTKNNGLCLMHATTSDNNSWAAVHNGLKYSTFIPDWTRKSTTHIIPSNIKIENDGSFYLYFYFGGGTGSEVDVYVRNIQLEKGSAASPWAPHPKDLEGRGVSQTVQYYLATSQASGVTSSTSGWSTDITTQKLTADKKYLWNCYQTKYSDGTSEPISTPKVIGVYGDKGANALQCKRNWTGTYTTINGTTSAALSDFNRTPVAGDVFTTLDGSSNTGTWQVISVSGSNVNIKLLSYVNSRGEKGDNAKNLSITPSSQYFKSTDGGKTFAPNVITIKPTIQGEISFGKWQYSIDGGVSFTDVVSGQKGLTISNNVLTVSKDSSLYSDAVTMVTFRAVASDSSFYDTCSIAKIYDVNDIGDGRNLLLNTSSYRESNPLERTGSNTDDYSTYPKIITSIDLSANQKYTLQAKTDSNWATKHDIGGHTPSEKLVGLWLVSDDTNTFLDMSKGYAIFTAPKTTKYKLRVNQYSNGTDAYTIHLWDIKLEKGQSASGWSAAPEDVQTAILSTKSEISDVSLKVDKNKQAIEQRVEKTTYQQDLNLVKGDISKANEGLNKWRYEIYPKSLFASEYQGKSTMDVFAKNTNLTPSQSVLINDTDFGKSFAYGDNYIGYALTFVKFSAAKSVAITFKHDDGAHLYLNGKLIGGDDTCNTGSGESLTLSFIQGWNCLEVVLNEKSGGEYIGLGTTISALSECQLMNCYYGTPVARQSHITNQLVENTTNIKGISTKVSKVTSVIGDNGENFTSFKNDYSDFKQTMNGFKTTVGQTYVTKDDFNGLEIGGRNLLLYSQTIRAHNHYYGVSYLIDEVETFNGCPVWSVKNQWGRLAWSFKSHVIDRGLVKVGDTLTYSLYAKTNNASGKSISCSYRFKGNAQAYWFKGSAFNIGTSWARYSATFTVTKDMLATDTYMNEIGFEETASMSGDDKVYFACPKLERGTKATDYTEAPEDDKINGQNLVSNLPSNWEQGTVSESSAVGTTYANTKSSNANTIRPKELIPVHGDITISAAYSNQSKKPIRHWIAAYDINKNYLGNNYVSNTWNSFPRTLNMKDAKYIAIMVSYTDSSAITPSDISQICLKIERGTSATPFTLAPEDVNGKIVNVETIANQTAKQFEWIVKGGDKSSSMVLTDDFLNIVANNINLTGKVTFNSLSSDAKNEIGKVAQSKVDDLQIGGRNLLVQKNITEGYLSTDGKGSFVGSGGGDQTSDWIDVSGNKYITVTLYEDFTNTNNSGRYCEYDADKNCINTVVYNPRQKSSIIIELKSNTKYIRVTAIECKTRRYKIEAGNKATDWTPAPEDVSQDATNKASQALTDANNYSSNAVNWVTSNGSSTTSLNSMVKKWTDGAVSDTTQMNGGWIKANTITASKIAIGDFTNYCQLDKDTASSYGFTATDDTKGVWFTASPIDRDKHISQWFTCEGGQKLYVEYDLSTTVKGKVEASDTDISYLTSGIMIYAANGAKQIVSYTRSKGVTATSDGAITHVSLVETLPADTRFFKVVLQTNGQGNTFSGTLKIRNPQVRKATTGKLIVDGSITADKIAANAITADKIATDAIKSHNYISSGGTQGSFLNLKDGSFTAPNLSWDLNGNLIAKNANLSGEITATNGSIGKFKITDQWLITGSGSTCAGLGGSGQAFWAGAENSTVAPFRVEYDGKLYANGATISGDITATTGKIGDLTLKDGILTGTGSYSEPYTEDDDGTVTSTITTNYITKLFGKGLTIDSTVKYSDEDDVYSYKVSVLPDEISFTDGEEIGMLGAGGLQILQVNDNSDSYSSEANEVSLSSGASNFYYTTPVNQTTDKYLHVCFSADGASFMASQGDKFNSFDIGYSSAKYSGNFAANKFVYTGNSLNYVECFEANDTTNVYFHSSGYYSFRVNNEGNWSNETQSVYITGHGVSVPGQIGLYSQEMSNYVARYYIAGSTKSTAIGNNSYQTRIYGSSVWANKAVSTSDVRLKQDFQSLDKFEDLYMQLQPVSFKYIDGYDKSEDRYFGLKAQPTEKLFEDMGENPDDYAMFNKFGIDHEDIKERIGYDVDFDEEHGLDYTNLITLNTHMVQKTRRELAELQKENAELKDMLKTIVKKINM